MSLLVRTLNGGDPAKKTPAPTRPQMPCPYGVGARKTARTSALPLRTERRWVLGSWDVPPSGLVWWDQASVVCRWCATTVLASRAGAWASAARAVPRLVRELNDRAASVGGRRGVVDAGQHRVGMEDLDLGSSMALFSVVLPMNLLRWKHHPVNRK